MSGILYVTGTPIGNLSDFSPRALQTLESVDFIAAEDTRVTLKLLNHFGVKKPMVNSTLVGNASTKDRWKYLYAETIDKIDKDLFAFLLKIKSRCISKGHELDLGWTGKEPELATMGLDLVTFRTNADYLMGTGLMTRIHQERHDGNSGSLVISDEYYVTEFGVGFVEYVKEYNASEEADAEVVVEL